MPLVSIIIPVFNTAKYLRTCLNSVVNQTYKNIEILIINDHSTDNSKDIIEEYQNKFKNVKVIHNKINLGVSISRNIGLDEACGDYIYFVDSDDYLDLTAIEKMIYLALEYDSKLVECQYKSLIGNIPVSNPNDSFVYFEKYDRYKENIYDVSGYVWNKLFSHDLIDKLRFPEGLIFEDIAFTIPLITKVKRVLKTDEALYNYRRHFNSTTLNIKLKPNLKVFDIFDIGDKIITDCKHLDTYEEFANQLEDLIKSKNLIALNDITTWLMNSQDKNTLLNLIYLYLNEMYDMTNFENWEFVKNRSQKQLIYRTRIKLLKKRLELIQNKQIYSEDPFNDAKRIITKNKKPLN